MPKISVIIPVYNAEKYLEECLDSVVGQTLKDIEIICINDGSTDGSLKILEEYTERDDRIILLNQENKGADSARNLGIELAAGRYLAFLDSDDWVDTNFYEKLYDRAIKTHSDIVRTEYKYSYSTNEIPAPLNEILMCKFKKNRELTPNDHSVVIWNAIYKTSFIKNNKILFADIKTVEDVYFTVQASFLSKKTMPMVSTCVHYRQDVENCYSNLTLKKIINVEKVNNLAVNFLNNVHTKKKYYINEFKRCLWRYDDIYKKSLQVEGFDDDLRKAYINSFYNAIKSFKYSKQFKEMCSDLGAYILFEYGKQAYFNFYKNNKIAEIPDIVVSLTSFPARINVVYKTIESLLSQTFKAGRIILWLSEEQFSSKEKELPKELLALCEKGLVIEWCSDIKSYKKLIPALKKYSDSIIVTADDDLIYQKDWLKDLILAYIKNPEYIHCHRAHLILFDKKGKIKPYKEWVKEVSGAKPSFNNFLTGVGGVLYPPNVLKKDVFDEEKFIRLAPMADDIWFWAMAVLNDTKINVIQNNIVELNYIKGTQENCLYTVNITKNDEQLKNVLCEYPEILKKLKKIKSYDNLTFWQRIFSVRNEKRPNKTYKIVTILGVKIKFQRRKNA